MPKSPKVCMLAYMIPPHYGGAGRLAVYYSSFLSNDGKDVELLTCIPKPDPVDNVKIIEFKMPDWYALKGGDGVLAGIRRHLYDPVIIWRLRKYFKENNIQIVHCLAAKWFSLLAVQAARLAGIPSIIETTLLGSDDALALKNKKLGWISLPLFKKADCIVNQSPSLQDACLSAGVSPDCNELIVNPANVHRFHPLEASEKQKLRVKLGIDEFENVLITVGIVRPRKNTADIVSTFLSIAESTPGTCLVVLGPHDKDEESRKYSKEIFAKIEKSGKVDRVLFAGEVDNVSEWMQASDVFLFASHSEGLPLVMPEALSCGLPIVSTPIQDIANFVISEGETGFVVSRMEDGAQLVLKLLEDADMRHRFSKAARLAALSRFSEEVVMGQYYELYSRLTGIR